jgi:hypothetical protein
VLQAQPSDWKVPSPSDVQILQQTAGYDGFETRRQNKFSKAIEGNAMMREGGVDEGVDVSLK